MTNYYCNNDYFAFEEAEAARQDRTAFMERLEEFARVEGKPDDPNKEKPKRPKRDRSRKRKA